MSLIISTSHLETDNEKKNHLHARHDTDNEGTVYLAGHQMTDNKSGVSSAVNTERETDHRTGCEHEPATHAGPSPL